MAKESLTMSMLILKNAMENELISETEFEAACSLLNSQGRVDKLVKTNKELRGIIENYSSTVLKLNYILKLLEEYKEEVKVANEVVR